VYRDRPALGSFSSAACELTKQAILDLREIFKAFSLD
jgi:hypothetical protein